MIDNTPPRTIYLQWDSDEYDITWSEDQINDDDTEYIIKSEYDELMAKVTYYESVVGLADILVDIPIDPDKAHLPPPF